MFAGKGGEMMSKSEKQKGQMAMDEGIKINPDKELRHKPPAPPKKGKAKQLFFFVK
jgi:hypothetical protein